MSTFTTLGVPARLVDVLARLGIDTPTPVQTATIPDALAGRDVLGRGRTGSGKTYAFLLPMVARLAGGPPARAKAPRALVLAPTRELASQIDAALAPLAQAAGLTVCTVFGGVSQNPQVAAIRRGVDIVVACPGRLEDIVKQGHCTLSGIEITVLDEADHLADLGFLPAVRRLLTATPANGQRLLFSATLDKAVGTLVRQFLHEPVRHEVEAGRAQVPAMNHHVLHIERDHRLAILVDLTSATGRTVVFTRTKHGARALTRQLNAKGVRAVELHGNLAHNARTRNLDAFHSGEVSVLVATDIAARGIHVDDVALVIHADPPAEHKAYVHRSGRTARAGSAGTVVTLMTSEQVSAVRELTRDAGIAPTTTRIQASTHPVLAELAPGERVLEAPIASGPAQQTAPRGRRNANAKAPARNHPARSASAPARRRSSATRSAGPGAAQGGTRGAAQGAQGATQRKAGGAAAFSAGRRFR